MSSTSSQENDSDWYLVGFTMPLTVFAIDCEPQAELVRQEDNKVPPMQWARTVLQRHSEASYSVPGVQRVEKRTEVRLFSTEDVEDMEYLNELYDMILEDLMTPTIGDVIHCAYADESMPCRAAIVTGIDYGATKPRLIYVAVFRERGDVDRAVLTENTMWHRPEDCTQKIPYATHT